jgi:hypothetical protein
MDIACILREVVFLDFSRVASVYGLGVCLLWCVIEAYVSRTSAWSHEVGEFSLMSDQARGYLSN